MHMCGNMRQEKPMTDKNTKGERLNEREREVKEELGSRKTRDNIKQLLNYTNFAHRLYMPD